MKTFSDKKQLLFVIYDGISNTVFPGQVLATIEKLLQEDDFLYITLVSFERGDALKSLTMKSRLALIDEVKRRYGRFDFVLKLKWPFLGRVFLWHDIRSLKLFLKERFSTQGFFSKIVARGPLAGWIVIRALRAISEHFVESVVVQARGLAAEEFRYEMQRLRADSFKLFVKKFFHSFLYSAYRRIELAVYQEKFFPFDFTIEVVSPALKKYLVDSFKASDKQVALSLYDIPARVDEEQVKLWRLSVREELGISQEAYVYCYVGSAHAWQSVDEMILFARKKCKESVSNFFVFYSGSVELFKEKLQDAGIPSSQYRVRSIDHKQIYRYLSVADAGLLFRENDIVNWVSRPTKMLEYQAVGLVVIHNNTIAWLVGD